MLTRCWEALLVFSKVAAWTLCTTKVYLWADLAKDYRANEAKMLETLIGDARSLR